VALTAEDGKVFKALWQRLGLSVDWTLEYSTINDHSRRIAQMSFLDLFRKGHVYQVEAPTQWDVDFRTAVAQAEVEDRPQRGAYHNVRFGVEGGGSFVIATTRPELLPACVAVATHSSDERYRALVGKRAITPLFRTPVPIFASDLVDPEKGTGILMVCTFGDAPTSPGGASTAWRCARSWAGRASRRRVRREAFPASAAANAYYASLAGRTVKEAQKAIVEQLRDPAGTASGDGQAPLQGDPQPIEHPVKFYEKGDRPLEFITTRQWFVRILEHKAELLAAGDQIQWHPEFMGARYKNWTENLQLDWCVSRQRFFGVPFPLWYPVTAAGETDFAHPIPADPASLPIDPMTAAPPGYSASQRDQPGGFRAEADVFDTWFTSSMTPQIAGASSADRSRRRLFPMDVRPRATRSSARGPSTRSSRGCCTRGPCPGGTRRSRAGSSIPTARRCRRARATS
jgi:valyl-tRNA synthetase